MSKVWDEARIQQYIDDGIEESLNLDYKAAGALGKSDGKKKEITKDVSAMANSDGGLIFYGMHEQNHLPGPIDPFNRGNFSKEWLEQVINNIRPKIDGLLIHPVSIGNSNADVVYVVEIPKGLTAHQAMDKRYYKRFNFQSVMMDDYEIRDVMNRLQYPRIELQFQICFTEEIKYGPRSGSLNYLTGQKTSTPQTIIAHHTWYDLKVWMKNIGRAYAQYVEARIEMPYAMSDDAETVLPRDDSEPVNPTNVVEYSLRNTVRDIIGSTRAGDRYFPNHGPARHVPIFPGLETEVDEIQLCKHFGSLCWGGSKIRWTTYADNAPPQFGEIAITDIRVVDEHGNEIAIGR